MFVQSCFCTKNYVWSESVIIASIRFPFFVRLWQLIVNTRKDFHLFAVLGFGFRGDVITGGWSVSTKDWPKNVSLLVHDLDGKEMSDVLSSADG